MTTLHQRLLSLLALLLVMTSLAQEPPSFARVQALGQAWVSTVRAEPDGGSLYSVRILGTNQQFLGATPLPRNSNNVVQLLLARLDRSANAEWSRTMTASNLHVVTKGVARDSSSNIVFAGVAGIWATNSVLTFTSGGSLVFTNFSDYENLFLAKFDPDGDLIWARHVSRLANSWPPGPAVATGPDDSIFTLYQPVETAGAAVMACKRSPDGDLLWTVPATNVAVSALVVDGAGSLYVTGVHGTNSSIAGHALTNTLPLAGIYSGGFVAKFDAEGQLVWVRQAASNNYVTVNALSLDSRTNVVIAGEATSSNLFGLTVSRGARPHLYDANSPQNLFVAKLTTEGSPLWAIMLEDYSGQGLAEAKASALTIDSRDSIYVGGSLLSGMATYRFGGHLITQANRYGCFLAQLNDAGQVQWAKRAGGVSSSFYNEFVTGLAVGRDGLLAVGSFQGLTGGFDSLTVSVEVASPYTSFLALIPHPAPPLATELAGAELKVSWPTFPPEFELETATALGTLTLWSSNSVPVSTSNGTHSVTFPVDGPARYFRLRKPIQ